MLKSKNFEIREGNVGSERRGRGAMGRLVMLGEEAGGRGKKKRHGSARGLCVVKEQEVRNPGGNGRKRAPWALADGWLGDGGEEAGGQGGKKRHGSAGGIVCC